MKKVGILVILSLLLAVAVPAAAAEAAGKVKVMVAIANVRSGPAPDAAVLTTVENGRIFDVIDKIGDWYLIALPDNKQGYIIAAVVAEVPDEAKPAAPVSAPVAAPPVRTEVNRPTQQAYPPDGRSGASPMELSLFGGYGMTSVKGASTYSDTWSYQYLSTVTETTNMAGTSKGGMFFGGSFSYFFSPSLGIQLSGGYLKSDVPTTADFGYNWTWSAAAGGSSYNKSASWAGTGTLTVMPVSLDLVGRFGEGAFKASLSAGPTLFLNSFEATSTVGYGVSWYYVIGIYAYQSIDALAIPVSIPKTSWSGFGFNAGAEASYMFSPNFGIMVGARYFYCAPKDLPWTIGTGTFDGFLFAPNTTITGVSFTSDMAADVAGMTSTFKVNPSFFEITGGVKIIL